MRACRLDFLRFSCEGSLDRPFETIKSIFEVFVLTLRSPLHPLCDPIEHRGQVIVEVELRLGNRTWQSNLCTGKRYFHRMIEPAGHLANRVSTTA